MPITTAGKLLPGVVLIVAPHMDDEVLGCGGTIAQLPDKTKVYCIYVTDGSRSHKPILPWLPQPVAGLSKVRMDEAGAALAVLGIPQDNAIFLGLPDSQLRKCETRLLQLLTEHIRRLRPDHIFVPFRFDRHPDHLVVYKITQKALQEMGNSAGLVEYFIYYRWKLLPKGDIRAYIPSERLLRISIDSTADVKREALECYKSQTSLVAGWQRSPIISPSSIEERCSEPECYVLTGEKDQRVELFKNKDLLIRLVHMVEPRLKRVKDRVVGLIRCLGPVRKKVGID